MSLYIFDAKTELVRIRRQESKSSQQVSASNQQSKNIDFTDCQQSKQSQHGLSEKTTYPINKTEINTLNKQYVYDIKNIQAKAIRLNNIESTTYIDSITYEQLNTETETSTNEMLAANFANPADLYRGSSFLAANYLLTSAEKYILSNDFESNYIKEHKNKVVNATNLNELYTALEGFSRHGWNLCQRAAMSSIYTPTALRLIEREQANKWRVLENLAQLCWTRGEI